MNNTDPIKSIFSRGEVYSRATREPTKLIVVVGVWLLFGPTAWLLVAFATTGIKDLSQYGTGQPSAFFDVIGVTVCVGIALLWGYIIFRTTRNYYRYRHRADADGSRDRP